MSVIGLGTHFKQTTECFHISVNFWFIVIVALLSDFPSFAFFNSPFRCFFLFKHQNHVATPEKPKIIGKMANVPTAIIKRSPPATTYFACVLYIFFVFI